MRNIGRQRSITMLIPVLLVLLFAGAGKAGDHAVSPRDRAITSRIVHKLQGDSGLAGAGIDVETRNGVVTLKGALGSKADIPRAAELAGSVEGVTRVDNRIRWVNRPDNRYCVDGPNHNWACS